MSLSPGSPIVGGDKEMKLTRDVTELLENADL